MRTVVRFHARRDAPIRHRHLARPLCDPRWPLCRAVNNTLGHIIGVETRYQKAPLVAPVLAAFDTVRISSGEMAILSARYGFDAMPEEVRDDIVFSSGYLVIRPIVRKTLF